MSSVPWGWWPLLAVTIVVLLIIDLLAHRRDKPPTRRAAIGWSLFYVAAAVLFGIAVTWGLGRDAGEEYFAAWLLEKSLSVDNLLLFLIIFQATGLNENDQRRVLSWGVCGALVARGIFIALGSTALERWHVLIYPLGGLLLLLGIKMLWPHKETGEPPRLLTWLRARLPLSNQIEGHRFFVRENGRWLGTPLLLALLAVELSDVLFAVDSIPAVFSVSESPFIVYASNLFAILGLRALYVVLSGALAELRYLKPGLAVVLCFGGLKLIGGSWLHVPPGVSLAVIGGVLSVAVAASLLHTRVKKRLSAGSCSLRPEPPRVPHALPSTRAH
ncbi:MAG: TerC/Alx family metal homeostasis membrane protein [Myxococcaceae bacterium]